jgi:hypothetical protein
MTHCADGKRDGDPAKAAQQATDQAVATNANGEYTHALELLRNAQGATLFNYTEADQRLDRLNAIDPRNVGGLSSDEQRAKNRNLDACRGAKSCTDDVNTRYDRIVSDRAETTITAINAMKSLDLCAPGDTTCAAGSLVQLQAVRADMKAKGASTDQTDVIGLNAYIARASAAAGDASSLMNAVGAAAIGATASNAGNAGNAGHLSGTRTEIPPKADAATARSLRRENESADAMIRVGYNVEQNPKVEGPKNPDYTVNGVVHDNYAPETSNVRNIWTTVQEKVASGQTNNVVLNLTDSAADLGRLRDQFKNHPIDGLREIIVVDKNGAVFKLF